MFLTVKNDLLLLSLSLTFKKIKTAFLRLENVFKHRTLYSYKVNAAAAHYCLFELCISNQSQHFTSSCLMKSTRIAIIAHLVHTN